jgi:hypothetical protein
MGWLILVSILAVIAVPGVILIRRSRAGNGGVGPAQKHAPRDLEREVLDQQRSSWDGAAGSSGSSAP